MCNFVETNFHIGQHYRSYSAPFYSTPGNITKKLPRRTVVPVSDTVIFCVELEQPFPDAYWTRNGERLKEDSRISIACMLRQYTLTIRDCQADDSGEVAFVAGDCKTSTRFSVTGEDEARVKNVFLLLVLFIAVFAADNLDNISSFFQ